MNSAVLPERADDWPLVSVIMPIRNERSFVAEGLGVLLNQDYPKTRLEIIVADGMSDDGTREIVRDLQSRHPAVRLIDNPGRIVSTGLNAAIDEARGEVIIRVDGHATVAPDFVRQNVSLLREHPDAWIVGGPILHRGRTRFGEAVAAAMSHPLGVGMADHHFPNFEGYVEGAAFPAIRRWVFDRVGRFDPALVRNQDDEFSYRVITAGGRIYISPKVRSAYYVRESPGKLFKQYFQYSFWRIPVIRKHRRPTTVRQVIPPLFFAAMAVLVVAGLVLGRPWIAGALPALYAAGLLVAAASLLPIVGAAVAARVPLAIATMHLAYGAGIGYGLLALLFRPGSWDPAGSMSALSR